MGSAISLASVGILPLPIRNHVGNDLQVNLETVDETPDPKNLVTAGG